MSIKVVKITSDEDLKLAYAIREEVFVDEQKVPREEEIDQYETVSVHFLAYSLQNHPCGAARWRTTSEGVKLERFAVKKAYRGMGVGSALVHKVLQDIQQDEQACDKKHYLHAQLAAMPLYKKFGFVEEGEMFDESGIQHYKMVKKP